MAREERLIGSVFALEAAGTRGEPDPPFAPAGALLTATATSALLMLLEREAPPRIWLPSYLCPVLVDGAEVAGVPYVLYEVDEDLRTPLEALGDLDATDAVLAIHYFGFRNPLISDLREAGHRGCLIEDATQALLTSDIGVAGDYLLYSPRKFIGVPDGGVLVQPASDQRPWPALVPAPSTWWLDQYAAALLRREFDSAGGGEREWWRRSQRAQLDHPIGHFAMSDLSEAILYSGFDHQDMARRRRENYLVLAERLADLALWPELPQGVAPIGFPIRLAQRDRLRGRLFERNIYPPIHWPIGQRVAARFRGSHRLARQILTLPCDQRYDRTDMERMADIVSAALVE